MRQVMILSAVVFVVALAGISFLPAQQAAEPSGAGRQAWEYRVVSMDELTAGAEGDDALVKVVEAEFNQLGREGWELSEFLFRAVVFKRPRVEGGRP